MQVPNFFRGNRGGVRTVFSDVCTPPRPRRKGKENRSVNHFSVGAIWSLSQAAVAAARKANKRRPPGQQVGNSEGRCKLVNWDTRTPRLAANAVNRRRFPSRNSSARSLFRFMAHPLSAIAGPQRRLEQCSPLPLSSFPLTYRCGCSRLKRCSAHSSNSRTH